MGNLKTLKRMLVDDRKSIPATIMTKLIRKNVTNILSDKAFVTLRYKTIFHRKLDLKNPKTFNEKLQWLKLYDRNPQYTMMVDKYEVRKFVSEKIGEEYLFPCLGVWNSPEEIEYDSLPEKFVLKCTHDSGSIQICDKANLDKAQINQKFKKKLKFNMFWWGREWPYKDVQPRIIAEKLMLDESGQELKDYKFFCFNGEPKMILVCADRFSEGGLRENFYDAQWNLMPVQRPKHPNTAYEIPKPEKLSEMLNLARIFAKDLPFSRIDFYVINGKVYFGEITFFPAAGFEPFSPDEWDYTLGDWIQLPEKTNG